MAGAAHSFFAHSNPSRPALIPLARVACPRGASELLLCRPHGAGEIDSAIRRAFSRADHDGHGRLSTRQLGRGLLYRGIETTEAELRDILHKYDWDECGALDLLQARSDLPRWRSPRDLGRDSLVDSLFVRYSSTRRCTISRREIAPSTSFVRRRSGADRFTMVGQVSAR